MSEHAERGDDAAEFSSQAETRICRLQGCGGPRSGVCINSLPFDECPDVIDAPLDETGSVDDPNPRVTDLPDFVRLPGGYALGAEACDALLRQRGGIVVGLVAGPEAGKTTLIATIYELVTRRRMRVGFAGSETLRGLEERCHLARLSSNAASADTPRTPAKDQLSFTHLAIVRDGRRHDLVFSDRSGEHFDKALDRPGQMSSFAELARADVILVLVDLKALLKNPNVTTAAARKWFMAMDQHGILTGPRLILIGTKADEAVPTPRSTKATKALDILAKDLTQRARSGATVETRIVGCRPRKGETVIGEGLEALLTDLLADPPPQPPPSDNAWPNSPNELDLLMRPYRAKLT